jgi:hypothetical protein
MEACTTKYKEKLAGFSLLTARTGTFLKFFLKKVDFGVVDRQVPGAANQTKLKTRKFILRANGSVLETRQADRRLKVLKSPLSRLYVVRIPHRAVSCWADRIARWKAAWHWWHFDGW